MHRAVKVVAGLSGGLTRAVVIPVAAVVIAACLVILVAAVITGGLAYGGISAVKQLPG